MPSLSYDSRFHTIVVVGRREDLDLPFHFFLDSAVGFLGPAGQLDALPVDEVQFVVGQLAPPLLELTFELLPIACDNVPVHMCFLSFVDCLT
jgi:hypothetical protein